MAQDDELHNEPSHGSAALQLRAIHSVRLNNQKVFKQSFWTVFKTLKWQHQKETISHNKTLKSYSFSFALNGKSQRTKTILIYKNNARSWLIQKCHEKKQEYSTTNPSLFNNLNKKQRDHFLDWVCVLFECGDNWFNWIYV